MAESDDLSLDFLAGGGEMGERIRGFDWASTSLGAPETWSQSLRATVAIMLNNSFPMLLWWTEDYISIYNDAYIPVLGAKHPWGLGLPVRVCWEEIWHILRPLIDAPFYGGPPTWMDDIQLIIQRNQYHEETHFIISYSAIPDPSVAGGIGGVLATVTETTDQVISRRALATLSRLNAAIAVARNEQSLYDEVVSALAENGKDIPFCKIGYTDDQLTVGDWEVPPKELVHIPLNAIGETEPRATLTIGLNPYRRYDEPYRQFIQLATVQIATGLTNVLAKEKLERSEQHLREIIAQAPVAMCILTGEDHVIEVANRLMVELWGKPENEIMNKPVFDALPDARGQGLEEVMRDVYETGKPFYASEMPVSLIRHGELEVVYQNFVYQPYFKSNGHIGGVIALTMDVTEQVGARRLLAEELEVSKQLQRQKDDFIGMASHELKTPLTSLTAMLQVTKLKLKDHPDIFVAQAMDKTNIQVKKMSAMIKGFLDISRLESGKLLIEKRSFDLDILILEILEELRLTTTGHQLVYQPCGTVIITADPDKIASVISNLVSNAVKYSPKGLRVEVRCHANNEEVIVSVKDEGMGIKPQDKEKIFDRYYRVANHHTYHIAGFGIGLYLSAEIVRRHGGRIWVESESGVGSTFYFSLPN